MNVLIVENNAAMRRTIREFTVDLFDVYFECADGGNAFFLYKTHLPDWVLMDIEMQTLDGISATQQIIKDFPAAKIAIVTDYDDDDLREAAFDAGACHYIIKENLFELRRLLQADASEIAEGKIL